MADSVDQKPAGLVCLPFRNRCPLKSADMDQFASESRTLATNHPPRDPGPAGQRGSTDPACPGRLEEAVRMACADR